MAYAGSKGWLVDLFHGFPHVDFNFHNTTVLFTPDNGQYQQALLFNGVYLLFAFVTIFLIIALYFLVCSCYFCTKCANRALLKPRPSRSRCLRLLIGFLAVCSSAALGIGFYGNNKVQDGMDDFSTSVLNIYDRFDLYKFKTVVVDRYIEISTTEYLKKLEFEIFKKYGNRSDVVEKLKDTFLSMRMSLETSNNLLKDIDVDLKSWISEVQKYDQYRWWMLLGVLCWHLLLLLIILYAAYSERRYPFVVLAVMSVLSFLFLGISFSVETPMSIGVADFCANPREGLLQYVKKPESKALLLYYIDCVESESHQKLITAYKTTESQLAKALENLIVLENISSIIALNNSKVLIDGMRDSLEKSKSNLDELTGIIGCTYIKSEYKEGMKSICTSTLEGLALSLLMVMILILFLTFTLLCITPIWRAMAPLRPILKRDKYGVHIVTGSYQGPPGGSESFQGDSSFDASYKSIEDREDFEHVPLIRHKRDRPPSYHTIQGSTEFLSVEEEDKSRGSRREHSM